MRRLGRAVSHTGGAVVLPCEAGLAPTFAEPVYDAAIDRLGGTFDFLVPVLR